MTTPRRLTETELAELLPGEWMIGATNFPIWLKGTRLSPSFEYRDRGGSRLSLQDTVAYRTELGVRKTIVGVDRWKGDGFVWRGTGLLGLVSSRWNVAAADDSGDFAVIRFSKSLLTPAGIDVIARSFVEPHELRATVAADPGRYSLDHEEFAGLAWLDFAGPAARGQ